MLSYDSRGMSETIPPHPNHTYTISHQSNSPSFVKALRRANRNEFHVKCNLMRAHISIVLFPESRKFD